MMDTTNPLFIASHPQLMIFPFNLWWRHITARFTTKTRTISGGFQSNFFWVCLKKKSAPEPHGLSALLGSALFFHHQNQQSKPHFCWFLTRHVGAQFETLEDNKTSDFSEFLWRINLTAHAAFDTSIDGAGCQQLLTGHLASLDVSWMQCSQTSLMFFFLFYGFTTSNTPKSTSFSSISHWNHRFLQWILIAQPQQPMRWAESMWPKRKMTPGWPRPCLWTSQCRCCWSRWRIWSTHIFPEDLVGSGYHVISYDIIWYHMEFNHIFFWRFCLSMTDGNAHHEGFGGLGGVEYHKETWVNWGWF